MQVIVFEFYDTKKHLSLAVANSQITCFRCKFLAPSIAPTTSPLKLGPWSMTCESRKFNFSLLFGLITFLPSLMKWSHSLAFLYPGDAPSHQVNGGELFTDGELAWWILLTPCIGHLFVWWPSIIQVSPVRVTALIFHIVTISNWDQIKESSTNWAICPEQSKTWNKKPEMSKNIQSILTNMRENVFIAMNSENIQSIVTNMRENVFIATNNKTWQPLTRKEGDGARLQRSPPPLLVSLQLEVLRKQKQYQNL